MEHIKPQSGGHVAGHGEAQHESSDVNIKAIVGFGVFLVVSGIVMHFVLFGFYKLLDKKFEEMNPPRNPMVQAERPSDVSTMTAETQAETSKRLNRTFGGNPLNPMLQVDDTRDMDVMRKSQNAQIDEYQWTNKDTGSVRIPVDRAIDLIVERGLPNVPMLPAGKAAAQGPAASNAPAPSAATNPPAGRQLNKPASQQVKQ
jgi:hypothetical protein